MGLFDILRPKKVTLAAGGIGGFTPADPMYADSNITQQVPGRDSPYAFGEHMINPLNRFQRYQEITEFDPYVFSNLIDLALALGKGFELGIDDEKDDELSEAELDKALKIAKKFSRDMDLQAVFTEAGRLLCQDGTTPIILSTAEGEDKSAGILRIEFAPMPYVTLWPENFDNQNVAKNATIMDGTLVLRGKVDRVVLNEFTPYQTVFKEERFVLLRHSYQNYMVRDRYQRYTIGLYGRSLIEPLMDTIKYRQNLLFMNDRAIKRYGKLLLNFEYTALAKLVEERQVSVEDAQKYIDTAQLNLKKLEANADFVTCGFNIQPIESGGSWDIDTIKKSLESDICTALFGGSGGSGQASMTFASAYVSRMNKIMGMESLRKVVKRGIEEIVHRHLIYSGISEEIAESIVINLDPINEPEVDPTVVMQMNTAGKISDQNMYRLFGWSFEPPTEEEQLQKQQAQLDMQTEAAVKQIKAKGGNQAPGEGNSSSGTVKSGAKAEQKAYTKE